MNDLLTIKELAAALKRSRFYVLAMKRRGFQMPGGVATVAEARRWLVQNPKPMSRNNTQHSATSA